MDGQIQERSFYIRRHKAPIVTVLIVCTWSLRAILGSEATNPGSTDHGVTIDILNLPQKCHKRAANGNYVSVDYQGKFLDDKVFDSSGSRGRPIIFKLGSGQVIEGLDIGIVGMCLGEKRRLTIPPDKAYGKRGVAQAGVPADATLVFDIALLSLKAKRSNEGHQKKMQPTH